MMFTFSARRRALVFVAVSLAVLVPWAGSARAGMKGQPQPPADAVAKIRAATAEILGTGDLGKARPELFVAVESVATTDVTPHLATVVRDDTSFNGLLSTFEEAAAKKGDDARFARYNLARVYWLRSRLATGQARVAAIDSAGETMEEVVKDSPRDRVPWEFLGDIRLEQNDVDGALAAFGKISTAEESGAAAYAQLRTGDVYRRANRPEQAEAAYRAGIRLDASSGNAGRETLHRLYQGLAEVYFDRNNEPAALDALQRSTRVTQEPRAPFRMRLDVAQRMLRRGLNKAAIAAYADAAVRFAPDDEVAKALRDQARAR